ncbi:MAG TPA: phytanoyl-CoA dioxygenase family protein [Streptosporangiaceae bacterium]|nr:phytanoyl-CoA dioxygenase family protein [Streptosporangiaceae bacterium]
MLTTSQVDHFRTFGFIVLRGYLADRISALRAETDAAIRDAYAATYDERVIDGISGHYLPVASRLTPVSTSLACDDARLIDAAEQLLDGPVIPECPEGVLYFSEAGWHTDDGIGVRGVKFAAYFDQLTGDTGALRLVPGSHHPEQNARLAAYSRRRGPDRGEAEAAAFPGYVADASPGDVIAFDLHTWHASFGGRDRLAWTAVYHRCPETGPERERTLRSVHDSFEQAFRGFDRTRYPVWRDWLAGAAAHPRRAGVIERMRHAGALDLPGARDGW